MPLTFPRAPEVAVGEQITSAQAAALARAFNARLRLIGDLSWRISWYWFSLWRQVRNPDVSAIAFPPQGEWWDIYGHINPDYTGTNWPDQPPGEPEGGNLANPAMAFIHGYAGGASDEPDRMTIPMAHPDTDEGRWQLGKDQRGGYDPETTALNAPAFDAAVTAFGFGFGVTSPFHKAYGGKIAQPSRVLDNCGTTSSSGLGIPSYEIKFTALRADVPTDGLHGTIGSSGGMPTVTYAGTCPCGTEEHVAGHVLGVVNHPLYYKVFVSQGDGPCTPDIDRLPTRDWIPGPYDAAPVLQHTEGDQLYRSIWQFHADYRGSDEQRADDTFRIEDVGWDNQAFFTSQYPLAPARAAVVEGLLEVVYPTARIEGAASIPSGTPGTWMVGGTTYATADNFVLGGFIVRGSGLAASATLVVRDGSTVIASVVLTPGSGGAAAVLRWFPAAAPVTALTIELTSAATFTSSAGWIEIEIAEILAWRPQYWDAYLCTRNGGSQGGGIDTSGVDGRGLEFEEGPQLTRDLLQYGCLINPGGLSPRSQADWINDNPVYDAARRLTRSQVRVAPRRQLVGYEVVDGKSVLYFRRYAYGNHGDKLDMFDGIAPPFEMVALGAIQAGITYVVRGTTGSVVYDGETVLPDEKFTGGDLKDFVSTGDCEVWIVDGIRHTAPKAGWTNEWVCFLETKCYHTSDDSIWKPDAYSDYFLWNNRCLFYAAVDDLAAFNELRRMVAINYGVGLNPDTSHPEITPLYISTLLVAPEAPSELNFAAGTDNRVAADDNFCDSCRIYESPYEIESCVVHDWADDQVIKITLTGRLRHHPDAPSTVSMNVGSWSSGEISSLGGESYRTDDNAMRQYVLFKHDGTNCSWKTGDAGAGSSVPFIGDNPFGSCFPTWHFVRLMPEPYEDGNTAMEPHDARACADWLLQAETYLRIICEQFVDGVTSGEETCRGDGGNLYDFTYENLCFQAFEGRWIGALSLAARPDDPPGFGPLPNTLLYAEVFNRIAQALNLLTKMRVEIPVLMKARSITGSAERSVALAPSGVTCSDTGNVAGWLDGATPEVSGATVEGVWDDTTGFTVQQTAAIYGCPFTLRTERTDQEWKVEIDSQFAHALPDHIAELFDAGKIGVLAKIVTTTQFQTRTAVAEGDSDGCCRAEDRPCHGHWRAGSEFYAWLATSEVQTTCGVITAGRLTAAVPPAGDFNFGRDSAMNPGVFCSNSSFSMIEVTLYQTTPFVEWGLA